MTRENRGRDVLCTESAGAKARKTKDGASVAYMIQELDGVVGRYLKNIINGIKVRDDGQLHP